MSIYCRELFGDRLEDHLSVLAVAELVLPPGTGRDDPEFTRAFLALFSMILFPASVLTRAVMWFPHKTLTG